MTKVRQSENESTGDSAESGHRGRGARRVLEALERDERRGDGADREDDSAGVEGADYAVIKRLEDLREDSGRDGLTPA